MKNSTKRRYFKAWIVCWSILLTAAIGTTAARASAESEKTNLKLLTTTLQNVEGVAGHTVHMEVQVQAKDGVCVRPEFEVIPEDGAPFIITNVKSENVDYGNGTVIMDTSNRIKVSYDITVDDYAGIGQYSYYITYTDPASRDLGASSYDQPEPGMLELRFAVIGEKMPPQLLVSSDVEFTGKAGETVTLKLKIKNAGELQALGGSISVGFDDEVLIPDYAPLTQKIGNLMPGESKEITVSYKISEEAENGRLKLPITMTYKNARGTEYTSAEQVLYLYIEGKELEKTPQTSSVLLLNTVKQNPASPKAGEKMTVSFYLENEGTEPIREIKLTPVGLSSGNFEPVSSEPYQYIDMIAGGKRKKVEVEVKVGKDITEGLNSLDVQYSYVDGNGEERMETVTLYILNVQGAEKETVISRPKLMVSNFYTDAAEVKAGNVFDFTFEILNTNDSIAAKNIKVTVTGAAGTFSVTSGGNSFFVQEIKPGKTAAITINLKASAAVTTGAYPISVRIEYEYEGMLATEGYSGEIVEEEILLQVKENLRPSVENVYVGWGTVTVNQAASMNFEFYNMGKSTLNNTYVTIEGDFILANGSNSYYIGNIAAGMPEYVEFEVIPLTEGDAVGKMILHMEDSNGDEVTMEKEFTVYVMGDISLDDPWIDPGIDPGLEDPSLPADGEPEEAPIVSLWIFLLIQAAVLVTVIPVTRSIYLTRYRKKLEKEDVK